MNNDPAPDLSEFQRAFLRQVAAINASPLVVDNFDTIANNGSQALEFQYEAEDADGFDVYCTVETWGYYFSLGGWHDHRDIDTKSPGADQRIEQAARHAVEQLVCALNGQAQLAETSANGFTYKSVLMQNDQHYKVVTPFYNWFGKRSKRLLANHALTLQVSDDPWRYFFQR